MLKLTKQVRNDKKILGIINVGDSIPTCLEAIIFIALIQVSWPTLVSLISDATLGAYLGAIIANKIKLSWSQLFIVSIIMLLGQKKLELCQQQIIIVLIFDENIWLVLVYSLSLVLSWH
ncbi:hypothetical protein [Spiroplasma endosymbiont of Notiophilus biguttatus]|uniref:hypothetical protein n=1 Tax=Spiroplasma endosymbiont of Notiophilus biguttatus TaxID=3066285 RepID=UPI00313D8BBD